VVLVFQYLQKNAELREGDLTAKTQDLRRRVSERNGCGEFRWIAEKTKKGLGDRAFFLAPVNAQMSDDLERVLKAYADNHGLEFELARAVQGIAAP